MKSNELKQSIDLVYDRMFIGVSYVLCFISAYLLLIYFEQHSIYRLVLLGAFVFSLAIISVKNIFSKLNKRDWFVYFVLVLAIFTGILNGMHHGVAVFYTNYLFLIGAAIIGYTLIYFHISKQSLFILVFSILCGLIIFLLQYELTHGNTNLLSIGILHLIQPL